LADRVVGRGRTILDLASRGEQLQHARARPGQVSTSQVDLQKGEQNMPWIERILCPIDFSEFSTRAYGYAQSLARHYQAKLFLEHVVDYALPSYPYYAPDPYLVDYFQQLRENARVKLEEFAKQPTAYGGTVSDWVLYEGAPAESILCFAEQKRADLIVMGTHGRKGFDHAVLGSVAEKVLRKASCSVLVVGSPQHEFVSPGSAQDPVQLRKLIFCTDLSEFSKRALDQAIDIAAEYQAELTVLHVLEGVPAPGDLQSVTQSLSAQLEEEIAPEARRRCLIKPLVRLGKPYLEIIKQAEQAQTDAVIMAVRGRNAVSLTVFGSTTYRVIQLGPCPVLAVKA
jgi:nucleotide-binding universal stress UspA family protein